MRVVYFLRKRFSGLYSIESVFDQISSLLPRDVIPVRKELRFLSKGIFARLFISLQAFFSQGDINHVTGDIHFVVLFLKRKRTVLTIHDIGFINHPNLIKRLILKYFWLVLPLIRVARVTVVSNATKLEVLRVAGLKFEPKIHVIYNPINEVYKPKFKAFNTTCPTICQVGTKFNKNLPRLIEAIAPLSCKLEIVGELTKELVQLLTKHNIDFISSVDVTDQQMAEIYGRADIVTFVSTYEGFGLPIVEANSIGRVVITSNSSSMPEIAGNAAHFVNPFDVSSIRAGFEFVIQDQAYRERLILNGFENVKRFQKDVIAGQYAQMYKSLMSKKS
jgi:glycosyltransferase involved in cell wall biosynthesis